MTALKTLSAALVAATVGFASLAAPAFAGGTISFTYAPQTQKDQQALQTGLALYSIFNAVHSGASVKQVGINNLAGIGQYGTGNFGTIYQNGTGHSATLNQSGNYNSYGIFQFGKNTNANVNQYGQGQTGATFQFGW
jgi:hypothetical protein